MKTKRPGIILFILTIILPLIVKAQIDNEFWFAAPDVTSGHSCGANPPNAGNGTPINLYVTAEQATTVRIDMPANPAFTPIEFYLAANEYRMIKLAAPPYGPYNPAEFENYPNQYPLGVQNKGIRITSDPGNITAYYELNNNCNRDIFALKGKNALGTDFYVSTQDYFRNGRPNVPPDPPYEDYQPSPYSGFVIVATEDNTTIQIYRNSTWQFYTTAPPELITITLNRGETFAFVSNNQLGPGHINGVHVTSNKKIAITWYDDSIRKRNNPSSYSYDICGDQLIPIDLIGKEYVVLKGNIYVGDDGGERFFVTATQNSTAIYVNGTYRTTINAGQVYNEQVNSNVTRIVASKPVYVNHISGTGGGGEFGGATLPSVENCTGSHKVTFTRNQMAADPLQLNVMVRNETNPASPLHNQSIKNFTLTVNGVSYPVPPSYFIFPFSPDSSWAVLNWLGNPAAQTFFTNLITNGTTATLSNPIALFHLGVQNGAAATGGKYGYFSDYRSRRGNAGIGGPKAPTLKTYCNLDPIMFAVEGGIRYKWFGESNPGDTIYLDNTTRDEVYFTPPSPGVYKFGVIISRDCFGDTIVYLTARVLLGPVANFEISSPSGCSPFSPTFVNTTTNASFMLWDFDFEHKNTDTISQSLLPNPFTHMFPENLTDTPQVYRVKLMAWAEYGRCPSERLKTITVLPNVRAGFIADTNMGCNPLVVNFTDTTRGFIDTANAYWDFVTYQQSYTPNTSYTFVNNTSNDKVFDVRLIGISLYGCSDTAHLPVTVHPYINANFALDNLAGCSPFATNINPGGSVGVNTYHWNIFDGNRSYLDSVFVRNNNNTFAFNHNDATQPYPDTLFVSMYGLNAYGCPDTALTKRIIVYPEVHSVFIKSDDNICDSVEVGFINNSIGYKLLHDWDLGDGTTFLDTTGSSFVHRYFNRTSANKIYTIKLITRSDYFCTDTMIDYITVHPFVKANFAIDYANNCSPLNVQFSNISLGGSQFDWDFGDGVKQTTFSTTPCIFHTYENNSDNDTIFYIKLKATNAYACADSVMRSIYLFPQVAANFDFGTSNVGCNPLPVTFINASKGKNINYMWDFGDKTYSTSQDPPPKTYQNNTNYDTTYFVTLTVTNPVGCDSSMTKPVQVYSKVTADFAISRLDSCSPFKIRVDNYSSGGIVDFIWKYTPTDSIVLHNFSNPNIPTYHNTSLIPHEYEIKLRTLNSHGCEAVKVDTVTVFPEMFARFTPDKIAGCEPLQVSFINQSNIIPGTSFVWSFGDGKYSNLVTPAPYTYSHTSSSSVFRNIRLAATTQYGCFDDTTIQVEIYPYIYAHFTIDRPSICSDDLFTIDRTNTRGGINHYYWDYENDGIYDDDMSDVRFEHTYSNKGATNLNRTINLTVTNPQGCDTSWTENIMVYPEVRAAFTVDDAEFCYPQTTVFTNNSEPAVPLSYYWNFGDGAASTEENPSHTYRNFTQTSDQNFTVSLTATSEYGCDSSVSANIIVHPKPVADFTYPVTVDCPPFTVPFRDRSKGVGLSYAWDFDNGHTSTEANPTETFYNEESSILEKQIQLIVTTAYSCSDTSVKPIRIYPGVSADFTASTWAGCNPLEIDFDGTATNESEYYWYVDGKVVSNYEDPSYRFVNETAINRIFNVRFRAISAYNCWAETTKQVTVYPKPTGEFMPQPVMQDFDTTDDRTTVIIRNYTLNNEAWDYLWDFGDGTTSDESSSSFTKEYTHWGDINNGNRIPITMFVNNKSNAECSDTIYRYVVINPPIPQVDLGPDIAGCMPFRVEFPSFTKYNYPDSYQWDFGYQGLTSTESYPDAITYDTAGTYMIRLSVSGDGGTNWDYKRITVYPKPVIDFTFAPDFVFEETQTEPPTPIKFFNSTIEGNTYLWDFGDGNTSTEFEPIHVYADTGHYYITLISESTEGCVDTMTSETPVIVKGARLIQFPNAFIIDPSNPADEYYDPSLPDPGVFRPVAQGVEKYRLEIYNRWGELIFVSTEIKKGWNGFVNGRPAKQDVYVWKVNITFSDGKPFVTAGDVTLIVREPGKP